MSLKGIILAGGTASRLSPLSIVTSKQLMPIYNKPMIYYPLATLIAAGIKEIAIITTRHNQPDFQKLLSYGQELGINISYYIQEKANGIAESLIITEDFLCDSPCCLILGDNIFYGNDISQKMLLAKNLIKNDDKAHIFAYHVKDPERYGVVEFDKNQKPISITEKPKKYISNYAVTGVYFYPSFVNEYVKQLKPSKRGELEISELNEIYLNKNKLNVHLLDRGTAWLDTGTHDSMLAAGIFVKTIEERQNLLVGSIEYESLLKGFISEKQYISLAQRYKNSEYSNRLMEMIR